MTRTCLTIIRKEEKRYDDIEIATILRNLPWYCDTLETSDTGEDDDPKLWKEAMRVFLENSVASDVYGDYEKRNWTAPAVAHCWSELTSNLRHLETYVPQQLLTAWTKAVSQPDDFRSNHHNHSWLEFGESVCLFCLAAGCPTAHRNDPFKSLDALRDLVSRQFAYTADLHSRIHDRDKQIMLQQRMITALAYRNVLENLSAVSSGFNPTEKWKSFLDSLFKEAGNKDSTVSLDPRFLKLYAKSGEDARNGISLLKETAEGLFSQLSRTVHHFQSSKDFDQYVVMPGQYDPVTIEFLSAIRPKREDFTDLAQPDWEKERKRYVTTAMTAKSSHQTNSGAQKGSGGGNKGDSTTASEDEGAARQGGKIMSKKARKKQEQKKHAGPRRLPA